MIKLENFEVMGWEHAIRGMRNPMNSWEKSDSEPGCEIVTGSHEFCRECDHAIDIHGNIVCDKGNKPDYVVGYNDHSLMMKLRNAGTDHRKFMRMIQVYVDITAPLYWWKEFDTYKVGTVANSCSTMHKIHEKEFTMEDFSHEDLISDWVSDNNDAMYYWRTPNAEYDTFASPLDGLRIIVGLLNSNRNAYIKTKNKKYWKQMIQLLPTSYNQKRTVMLNYETLANIYKSRKNHKLDEWHTLCDWIEGLPYSELITGKEEE